MKSFKLVVLFCAVIAVSANPLYSDESNDEDGKIVGGWQAQYSHAPYQAVLLSSGRVFCGGTVIGSNTIVTAAHCVPGMTASQLRVRVGSADALSGGQLLTVTSIVSDVRYNPRTLDYDVAVIKVRETITNSATRIATLTTSEPSAGTWTRTSGWGTLQSNGSVQRFLQAVDVQIVDRSGCNRSYSNGITARMICAGTTGKDACQGDSGGPLTRSLTLVGIVSWGIGCGAAGYPGVYTNVANPDINWFIRANM